MKNSAIIFSLLFLLASCQDVEKMPEPDNLIPEKKMVEVLTDLAILHGARSYNKNLLQEKGIEPAKYIWEKYDIDSVQFRVSNEYYTENYRQYQEMYANVKENLEQLQVKYDSIREEEERKQDSIRSLKRKDSINPALRRMKDSILKEGGDLELIPKTFREIDTVGAGTRE